MAPDRRGALHEAFARMVRIRAFEEAVAEGHARQVLPGLLHLSIGAEAVAVGVVSCLGEDDRVFSGHRPHGHFLAAGTDPRKLMAELAGRESGLCRGRGGTMHLMDDRAVMATGIVGGTLAIAVGAALAQAEGAVTIAFFGDGAAQNGAFHESMNLASLWEAPVLFVCENNGWAEFSSRQEHTRVGDVVRYGDLYGMPARGVDGSDVEAVTAAAAALLDGVRAGEGPALLEAHVARLRPHYEGDLRRPATEGDPLVVLEQALVALGTEPRELEEVRAREGEAARALLESVLREPAADPALDPDLVFVSPL